YLVRRGGNYGWNVREGSHPYQPWRKPGPTPILPPIVEHSHAEARSLTGGYVYRGTRLKDLAAAYLYGEFDSRQIWGPRHTGGKVVWHREIADSTLRIVAFGEDAPASSTWWTTGGVGFTAWSPPRRRPAGRTSPAS